MRMMIIFLQRCQKKQRSHQQTLQTLKRNSYGINVV